MVSFRRFSVSPSSRPLWRASGDRASRDDRGRRSFRVIRPVVDLVPRVVGYGTARPGQVWQAVAEVKGRVVQVHAELKSGSMVHRGEVLLKIDPAEYDLAVAQLEADLSQIQAQLDELAAREINDRMSLEIEQASLRLSERELARVQSLVTQNAVSKSEVDEQERNVLMQRQIVQRLVNSLNLVPQQRKSLEAAVNVKKAGLGQPNWIVRRRGFRLLSIAGWAK